jgi:DNA-binding transcriptional ArsR family regulator
MAQRRTTDFSDRVNDLAAFARTMGHPARIAIVTTLMQRGTACCGELVDELPLAQPTVSQHLRELEKIGLIVATEDGPRRCYELDRSRIQSFCQAFSATLGTQGRKTRSKTGA